jgi:hypothetical protein
MYWLPDFFQIGLRELIQCIRVAIDNLPKTGTSRRKPWLGRTRFGILEVIAERKN